VIAAMMSVDSRAEKHKLSIGACQSPRRKVVMEQARISSAGCMMCHQAAAVRVEAGRRQTRAALGAGDFPVPGHTCEPGTLLGRMVSASCRARKAQPPLLPARHRRNGSRLNGPTTSNCTPHLIDLHAASVFRSTPNAAGYSRRTKTHTGNSQVRAPRSFLSRFWADGGDPSSANGRARKIVSSYHDTKPKYSDAIENVINAGSVPAEGLVSCPEAKSMWHALVGGTPAAIESSPKFCELVWDRGHLPNFVALAGEKDLPVGGAHSRVGEADPMRRQCSEYAEDRGRVHREAGHNSLVCALKCAGGSAQRKRTNAWGHDHELRGGNLRVVAFFAVRMAREVGCGAQARRQILGVALLG
jgi:hypothetical protein